MRSMWIAATASSPGRRYPKRPCLACERSEHVSWRPAASRYSLCDFVLLGQSSGNACCSGVLLLRLPRAYLGDLLASHPRLASTCVARNTDSQFSQWQGAKKVISWCLQSLRGVPRDAVFIALFGFRDPRASGCKTLATAANWGAAELANYQR